MDIHAAFQAAIASALERATPAGDDIDLSVSQMDPNEYVPRATYEELNARYHDAKVQRDFMLAVLAVDNSIMKPTDKITNILIDHILRNQAPNEAGFRPISMRQVAEKAGIGYRTVLDCKKRLNEVLDLYEQKTIPFYHESRDGKITRTDSILLKPKQIQQYPRLYSTSEPVTWGGNKERKQQPACPHCGSENVDVYKSTLCHHCHQPSHQEIYIADSPIEPITRADQMVEAPTVIDSTIIESVVETKAAEQTGICEVRTLNIDSNILGEVRTRSREKPINPVRAVTTTIDAKIEALCKLHGFKKGEPCKKCSCPLHYELTPYTYCVRCDPRRGYDAYSDIIDTAYPCRVSWGKSA